MPHREKTDLAVVCDEIDIDCSRCNICIEQCAFLKQYGTPGDIAGVVRHGRQPDWPDPYECSLCGLCGAVCPARLRPETMFLEMRRARVASGEVELKPYEPILFFERRGQSDLFSFVRLPEGGDTVLFPGCALPSTRPGTVQRLFQALQMNIQSIGVALGCCMKPSHDLGRQDHFEQCFGRLHDKLISVGVRRVITSCPNCQSVFNIHGGPISATTAYEVLAGSGFSPDMPGGEEVVIHDPCPQRYEPNVREAVRALVRSCGLSVAEMTEQGELTRCCGEGGMVKFVRPGFAENWTIGRSKLAGGRRIVTSCAGCTSFLGGSTEVDHILDLLF